MLKYENIAIKKLRSWQTQTEADQIPDKYNCGLVPCNCWSKWRSCLIFLAASSWMHWFVSRSHDGPQKYCKALLIWFLSQCCHRQMGTIWIPIMIMQIIKRHRCSRKQDFFFFNLSWYCALFDLFSKKKIDFGKQTQNKLSEQ